MGVNGLVGGTHSQDGRFKADKTERGHLRKKFPPEILLENPTGTEIPKKNSPTLTLPARPGEGDPEPKVFETGCMMVFSILESRRMIMDSKTGFSFARSVGRAFHAGRNAHTASAWRGCDVNNPYMPGCRSGIEEVGLYVVAGFVGCRDALDHSRCFHVFPKQILQLHFLKIRYMTPSESSAAVPRHRSSKRLDRQMRLEFWA